MGRQGQCIFYNRWMKSFFQNNDIETYSTHNEGKSIIAEKFIKNLKNKIYKYVASIYIDELNDIVNKYKNTYQFRIKMKTVDVKSNTHIDCNK